GHALSHLSAAGKKKTRRSGLWLNIVNDCAAFKADRLTGFIDPLTPIDRVLRLTEMVVRVVPSGGRAANGLKRVKRPVLIPVILAAEAGFIIHILHDFGH